MPLSIGQNASANYTAEVAKYADKAGIGNLKLNSAVFDDKIGAAAFEKLKPGAWSTSTNFPDFGGDVLANPASSSGAEAWVFITAPGTVSYTQQSEITRLNIFGTNSPPVVVGAKGMRDLTLSEALMEGFTRGRSVQPHIDRLESLMNVAVNTKDGFVNVPVYKVYSGPEGGGKDYGYYVIEQIEIEEQLRDLKGNATRAMVGVSLKQVPQYQVAPGWIRLEQLHAVMCWIPPNSPPISLGVKMRESPLIREQLHRPRPRTSAVWTFLLERQTSHRPIRMG